MAKLNFSVQLVIAPPPLSVGPSAPDGQVGVAYSGSLPIVGGVPPYSVVAVDLASVPPGLTVNDDGSITGPPTQAGIFNITGTAQDSRG